MCGRSYKTRFIVISIIPFFYLFFFVVVVHRFILFAFAGTSPRYDMSIGAGENDGMGTSSSTDQRATFHTGSGSAAVTCTVRAFERHSEIKSNADAKWFDAPAAPTHFVPYHTFAEAPQMRPVG